MEGPDSSSPPPAAAAEADLAPADTPFATEMLWGGFRGALGGVDKDALRAKLQKQGSLASIASLDDEEFASTANDMVEALRQKMQDGLMLTAEELATMEAVEAAEAKAGGSDAPAMWSVLKGELIATSEQVTRELSELDRQLDDLDVSTPLHRLAGPLPAARAERGMFFFRVRFVPTSPLRVIVCSCRAHGRAGWRAELSRGS